MKPAALWYFESVNLFKILFPGKFGTARTNHTLRTFQKNEYVYFPEQEAEEIYFVAKGRVKLFELRNQTEEVVKSMLITGEIFGELALADETTRRDFAQAVENNTVVYCLKLAELKELIVKDEHISLSILKLVGFKLNKLERKIYILQFPWQIDAVALLIICHSTIRSQFHSLGFRQTFENIDLLEVPDFILHKTYLRFPTNLHEADVFR